MEKDEIMEAVRNGEHQKAKLTDKERNVAIYRRKEASSYAGVGADLNDEKMNEIIAQHSLWKHMGVYEDNGKSREALERLISDCREGKVDIILAPSMINFLIGSEKMVNSIRELKGLGVGVYFLEEGYYTLDKAFDLIINIFITVAEEESRMKSNRRIYKTNNRYKEHQTDMM